MDAHPVRGPDSRCLSVEVFAGVDQAAGEDAIGEDCLLAVDVVEKEFECAHALDDSGLESPPLIGGDDAGNGVEGEGAFLAR